MLELMRIWGHLEDERLIGRSRGVQALGLMTRAPIQERGSCEVEFSRPVHRPVRSQEIRAVFLSSNRQITAGDLQLLNTDTPSSSRNRHHRVVLWRQEVKTSLIPACDPAEFVINATSPAPLLRLQPIGAFTPAEGWEVLGLYRWLGAVSRIGRCRVCRWSCFLYTRRRRPEQRWSPKPDHIPPTAGDTQLKIQLNIQSKWLKRKTNQRKMRRGYRRKGRKEGRKEE